MKLSKSMMGQESTTHVSKMSAQSKLAALTIANDRLVRHNIELTLTVAVLEDELRAVCGVRQGTDEKRQLRVN